MAIILALEHMKMDLSRRAFVGSLAVAGLSAAAADDGWVELFDGRSLQGWRPSENKSSWKVVNGQLAADGPRSHLFYAGPVRGANFRNFELEVDVPGAAGLQLRGLLPHGVPGEGFSAEGLRSPDRQHRDGESGYMERKKTGSLYGIRNIYKQFIPDDQWFKIYVAGAREERAGAAEWDAGGGLRRTDPAGDSGRRRARSGSSTAARSRCSATTTARMLSSAAFVFARCPTICPRPGGPAPVVDDDFRQIINIGPA